MLKSLNCHVNICLLSIRIDQYGVFIFFIALKSAIMGGSGNYRKQKIVTFFRFLSSLKFQSFLQGSRQNFTSEKFTSRKLFI